jgi:hypothetical protein
MSEVHDQIETARRMADILGPSSASAKAVEDYQRREAAGENPVCIYSGASWLVMPKSVFESAAR